MKMEVDSKNSKYSKSDSKLNSITSSIMEKINYIDLFGTTYNFRIDNKSKHTTTVSNILSIMFYLICLVGLGLFYIEFSNRFSNMRILKLESLTNEQNFNTKNFHISLKFEHKIEEIFDESNKNITDKEIEISKNNWEHFKILENFEKQFELKVEKIYKNLKNKNEYFNVHQNCTTTKENPYNFINSINDTIENHYCVEIKNFTLQGNYGDNDFSYIKISLKLNLTNFLTNRKELKKIYDNRRIKGSLYFTDLNYDASNYENPVNKHLQSIHSFSDINYVEKTDLFFNDVVFQKDFNPFMTTNVNEEKYIRFNRMDKILEPVHNREKIRINNEKPVIYDDQLELMVFYIRSQRMSEKIIVQPKKILEYLAEFFSLTKSVLFFLSVTVPLYNEFHGKFTVMQKVFKIDEEVKLLNQDHVKKIFEEFKIIEKNKKVLPIPEEIKENNNNENFNSNNNDSNRFLRNIIDKTKRYNTENNNYDNIDIFSYDNNRENNIDDSNFNENYQNKKLYSITQNNQNLNLSKKDKDNSMNELKEMKKEFFKSNEENLQEEINNNNNDLQGELNNNNNNDLQGELNNNNNNNDLQGELNNNNNNVKPDFIKNLKNKNELARIENAKIIKEEKLRKGGFFFERNFKDFFNFYYCFSNNNAKKFTQLTDNIFNENIEIIKYQSMMNEFELFKSLINEDILQIIRFISKPLVSLNEKEEFQEKKYLKSYFDLKKISDNLKKTIEENEKKNYFNFYSGIIEKLKEQIFKIQEV